MALKVIEHIEKVHPVAVAVVFSLLIVLLLPSGVLSDLRGENRTIHDEVKTESTTGPVLPLISWSVSEDGVIMHNNGFTWTIVGGGDPDLRYAELIGLMLKP